MALEFKLPDIGEGIAEGEIVQWLVKKGDSVTEHQPVVEVMTDKATVEVPAPQAGTVTELRAEEGDVVPVGDVIFVLDEGDGSGGSESETKEKSSSKKGDEAKDSKAKDSKSKDSKSKAKDSKDSKKSAPKKDAEKEQKEQKEQKEPAQAAGGSSNGAATSGGDVLEFKLPDIGEGVAEGEIVQWAVSVGDEVEEHQTVCEVMTDKATVEIPAPASGTVRALHAEAGDVVPVGTVIFELATAGAPAEAGAGSKTGSKSSGEAPARREEDSSSDAEAQAPPKREGGKVLAVPSARRVARELGIDLGEVSGTGRNGVVRRADVEEYASSGGGGSAPSKAPAAAQHAPASGGSAVTLEVGDRETRKPFRGVRRKIAEAMTRSKYTAVHFTVVEEVDVTDLVALRAKAKQIGEEQGVKVTYMPFIMKATANALFKFPELNSKLDETNQELVTYHYVNLGIATDTEQGLLVPVVDEVQSKGLLQLAAELGDLAARTREGKVKPDELKGGTFTITNAGNIGGTLATPVINFPEVGILGVHRIVKRPGVVETDEGDVFEVRQYMNLSISVDHRLVDGASAARFLVYMKQLLENPGLLSL